MAIRVACVALTLAAGWGLSALPVVCLLEEALYAFKPAICLTPVILTGAWDVPKLLLGSVSSKSQRKLGLKKTLLLFLICSCLGGEQLWQKWLMLQQYLRAGHLHEDEAHLLKTSSFQINITGRIAFPFKYYEFCVEFCVLCCYAWGWGRLLLYMSVFTYSWSRQYIRGVPR